VLQSVKSSSSSSGFIAIVSAPFGWGEPHSLMKQIHSSIYILLPPAMNNETNSKNRSEDRTDIK
ncbi:MAG: hypothetical protein WC007_14695, partial [Pelobacteraceae bacterium]